jgi:hypothetical protein
MIICYRYDSGQPHLFVVILITHNKKDSHKINGTATIVLIASHEESTLWIMRVFTTL